MGLLPRVLAAVLALHATESGAEDAGAPPLVLVVRTGKLARDEVSPSSSGAAGKTWGLAAAGVALTNIEMGDLSGEDIPLDRLQAALLPESVLSTPAKDDETSFLALDLAEEALEAARKALEPPGLDALHQHFGSPPARDRTERAALEAIDEGVGGEPSLAALEAGRKKPPSLEDLGKAKVSLVRIAAVGDSLENVLERDDVLRRILDVAGEGSNVIVLNAPAAGPGSAFARGPGLREGKIFEAPRSLTAVAALVSAVTGSPKAPKGATVKEPESQEGIHGLLR